MLPDHSKFIFSNQSRYRISRHLTFWLTCVVFFTLVYGSKPVGGNQPLQYLVITSYRLSFFEALAYLPLHVFLSYVLIYLLIPRFLFQGKYLVFLFGLLVAVLVTAALSNVLTYVLVVPYRSTLGINPPYSTFYYGLMAGLRGGLTVAGFAGTIKLAKYWYQQYQLNQQLEKEKLRAELQLLKAQVHPHFLFNTLNNLYALTLTNSAQAPEVVLKLSGLLRYMLYECNVPHVSLVRELQLMSDYLQLEKLRYGDRLDLSVNISGDPAGKLMAPLLLIPFLENSFKHGASEHLDQAWISVDILVRDNTLKFKVINAIPVTESPQVLTGGLGLVNVRKRLQLLYPGTHELKTIREGETFLVSLTLQLAEEQNQTTPKQPAPVQPYDLPLEQPS